MGVQLLYAHEEQDHYQLKAEVNFKKCLSTCRNISHHAFHYHALYLYLINSKFKKKENVGDLERGNMLILSQKFC